MQISQILAIASGVAYTLAYLDYNRQVIKGATKPNGATWLIWSVVSAISTTSYLKMSGDVWKSVIPLLNIGLCIATFALAVYLKKFKWPDKWDFVALAIGVIDSQIKEMERMVTTEQLEVVEIKRESHSAKEAGQRPVFNEIVEELKQGKYNGILTWAPDRIARNAGDLGRIVDLMDQKKLIEIRTFGQKFSNSPNDKFMLMILGSQAKLENDNKVVNVKRGLCRPWRSQGIRLHQAHVLRTLWIRHHC